MKLQFLAGKNRLFRATMLLAIANAVANVFNYLFQVSMAQLLTPNQFGSLASLLAVFVILSIFGPALQLASARFASRVEDLQKRALWIYLLKRGLVLGVLGASLALALTPALMWLLHIQKIELMLVLSASFFFALLLPVNVGMLQGLQRFGWVSVANIGTPFLRLALGVAFVSVGLGTFGALSSVLGGLILIFAVTSIPLVRLAKGKLLEQMSGLVHHFSWTAVAFGAFTVLSNVDVILAKHYLTSNAAGEYAALAVLGRVVLFAPVGVTLVLVPVVARVDETKKRRLTVLGVAIAYTVCTAGFVVGVFGAFPDLVVRLLVGNEYSSISPLVFRYTVGTFGLAISFLLMHYFLSVNRMGIVIPLMGAVGLQIGLISIFHSGVVEMATVRLVTGLFCGFGVIAYGLAIYLVPSKQSTAKTTHKHSDIKD